MKMQYSLIQELISYKFEVGHNAAEVKKDEGAANHNKLTRWFKKFRLVCKNFDCLTLSDWPIDEDSEVVL